ncbi:MAG: hypothetical protein D6760_06910, partial [Deltaproteobacteria bacterium]
MPAAAMKRWFPDVAVFAAALAACWSFGPGRLGFAIDNQAFFYVAERVAAGTPPHVSLVNHKLALAMLVSGWAMNAGRMVGLDDVMSVRLLSMAVAAGGVVLLWQLARRLLDGGRAALLALLIMLSSWDFFLQACMGVRPQVFVVFFMLLALVSVAHCRHLTAGAAAAAAFLCWQPAVVVLGAVLFATRLAEGRRATGRLVCAFAATCVLYETYFVWHGAAGEQLYQNFVMAFDGAGGRKRSLAEAVAFLLGRGTYSSAIRTGSAVAFFALLASRLLMNCGPSIGLIRVEGKARNRRHSGATSRFRNASIDLNEGAGRREWVCQQPGRAAAAAARRRPETMRTMCARPECVATACCAAGALVVTLLDFQSYPDRFWLLPMYAIAGAWLLDRLAGVVESRVPGAATSRGPSGGAKSSVAPSGGSVGGGTRSGLGATAGTGRTVAGSSPPGSRAGNAILGHRPAATSLATGLCVALLVAGGIASRPPSKPGRLARQRRLAAKVVRLEHRYC